MFCQQYPEIEIFSVEDTVDALFQLLEQGKSGSGLLWNRGNGGRSGDCESLNIRESRLMFCVNRDHPLAKEKEVTCEMIGREPLVMLTDQFYQTRRLKSCLKSRTFRFILFIIPIRHTRLRALSGIGVAAGF